MAELEAQPKLSRTLGLFDALSIGIGTMIGAGVFVLPGIAATQAGGSGVILSYILGGIAALLTALSICELATAMPKSGGGYYFISRAFGPLAATVIGWSLWSGLIFATAFYMAGFAEYLGKFIPGFSGGVKIIALVVATLLVLVNIRGAREASRLQRYAVLILLAILGLFALVGLPSVKATNFTPFASNGIFRIFGTSALLFVGYLGFEQIASVAEEIKNPDRNLPLTLIVSVVFVTILYALVMFIVIGTTNISAIDPSNLSTLVADVGETIAGKLGLWAMLFGGILATLSSANASIMAASRINYRMSRDRIFFKMFDAIHPKFMTPHLSIFLTGGLVLVVLLIGFFISAITKSTVLLETLATAASLLHIVMYILMNMALMALRVANVGWYKPGFRVPLCPVFQILGIGACLFLAFQMGFIVWSIAILIILLALGWYLIPTGRRTAIRHAQADFLERAMSIVQSTLQKHIAKTREDVGEVKGRVLIPIANPKTVDALVEIATPVASDIRFIHVFESPRHLSLVEAYSICEQKNPERLKLVQKAVRHCQADNMKAEGIVIPSHDFVSTVAQESMGSTYTLMGWFGHMDRAGLIHSKVFDVVKNATSNVLVLKSDPKEGFGKRKRVVVPFAGGPHAQLGLVVGNQIALAWEAQLQVVRVVWAKEEKLRKSRATREMNKLSKMLEEQNIEAEPVILTDRSIEHALMDVSRESDLIIVGASEEWRLKRRLVGSIPDHLAEKAKCAVLAVRASQEWYKKKSGQQMRQLWGG